MSPNDSGYSLSPLGEDSNYSPAAKRTREASLSDPEISPAPPVAVQESTPMATSEFYPVMTVVEQQTTDNISQATVFQDLIAPTCGPFETDPVFDSYFAELLGSTTDGGPAGEIDPNEDDDFGVETFDTLVLPEMVGDSDVNSDSGNDGSTTDGGHDFDPKNDVEDKLGTSKEKDLVKKEDPQVSEEDAPFQREKAVQQLCCSLRKTHLDSSSLCLPKTSQSCMGMDRSTNSNPIQGWFLPFIFGIALIMIYEIGCRMS